MADPLAKPKQASLEQLLAYKQSIEVEIRSLQQKLEAVDLSLQLLTSDSPPSLERIISAHRSKYASLTAQQAVQLLLEDHPDRAFKASEVAKLLKDEGFVPRAKDFATQVSVTLNRLVKKGLLEKGKKGAVNAYSLKQRDGRT